MGWHTQLWLHRAQVVTDGLCGLQPTLSDLSLYCGLNSNTTLPGNGGARFLPEPVDQDLSVHVLHREDVAWWEPARQVLGGQSEEWVINRQDS